jgi:hypothetical protein
MNLPIHGGAVRKKWKRGDGHSGVAATRSSKVSKDLENSKELKKTLVMK